MGIRYIHVSRPKCDDIWGDIVGIMGNFWEFKCLRAIRKIRKLHELVAADDGSAVFSPAWAGGASFCYVMSKRNNNLINLKNIIELVSEENKDLIIEAIESLIMRKLIVPSNP